MGRKMLGQTAKNYRETFDPVEGLLKCVRKLNFDDDESAHSIEEEKIIFFFC